MTGKLKITLDLYTDGGDLLWHEPKFDTVIGIPDISEYNMGTEIKLVGGATAVDFDISPIDQASFIYVLTNETITFKVGAGTEVTTIVADRIDSGDNKFGVFCMTSSGVSKLVFANPGTNTATVRILTLSK